VSKPPREGPNFKFQNNLHMRRRVRSLTLLNLLLAGAVGISGVRVLADGQSPVVTTNIYSINACSGPNMALYTGAWSESLSASTFPFSPYQLKLTAKHWTEDSNGRQIVDALRQPQAGDVPRAGLEVECGSDRFQIPSDFSPAERSKTSYGLLVTQSAGDLSECLTQWVANSGGSTTTNALPVLQTSWLRHSRGTLDIILLNDDEFSKVQNLLEHAYGKPDIRVASFSADSGRTLTYSPTQIGVVLSVTGTSAQTIITIIPRQMQ
jgi:hypothetical protein